MPDPVWQQTLNQKIQEFYDRTTPLWESVWGEHLHHGYYGPYGQERKERHQAQVDLITEMLAWAPDIQPATILDVGCGIGGSAIYLAERYQAQVTGISLSPWQVQRAQQRAAIANLDKQATFVVADALDLPFAEHSFDLVWALESAEHFSDKGQFLAEAHRVLKPGGLLLIATWCHRPVTPATGGLSPQEQAHLAQIYQIYCLSHVISLPEYGELAQRAGFNQIQSADWSSAVAPFWDQVITSVLTPEALMGVVQSGWQTLVAALASGLMAQGYRRSLIRFGLMAARKPQGSV